MSNQIIRIAIFASGNGSNAQRITEYFAGNDDIVIAAIYCNKPDAFVLQRANSLAVPSVVFDREKFYYSDQVIDDLKKRNIHWIILAGFLWLIPDNILKNFNGRIINIHPALLPRFGGKGMYGSRVHIAVLAAGERESGITIHYVNERYDEGSIIFQAKCTVAESDTPESLAAKVHQLEYRYFPEVIEQVILGKESISAT